VSQAHTPTERHMDAHMMTKVAIGLFALAALGGVTMLFQVFRGADRPWSWLAMGHGFLAAAGLTLLVYAATMSGVAQMVNIGLVVLLAAAAGGATLALKYHVRMLPLSRTLVLGHAALAVVGFVLVLVGARG
ncbi:MAG: hypothetical protein ACREO3_06935, partial [Arenimonas sp.]